MDLLYFILAYYGITFILVYGKVFEKVRPKHYFFHCPMCVGFWVGAFLFGINAATELFNFEYTVANFLILGGISSGTSYIMAMVFDDFGVKINVIQGGEDG